MRDIDRALADITAIREQVALSTLFHGLGPAALASTGVLALGVSLLQAALTGDAGDDQLTFLSVWIATAIIAALILSGEILRRRGKDQSPLADAVLQNALQQFLPAGVTGAALFVFLASFATDALWMLPGLWQILLALGLFSATRLLPGQTILAAAWYFLSGFGVLVLASRNHELSPFFMGIPFFVGQSIMAAVTWRATETSHVN